MYKQKSELLEKVFLSLEAKRYYIVLTSIQKELLFDIR